VVAVGVSSRKPYAVTSHVRMHRPLVAFDALEVNLPYYLENQPAQARAALASVGVSYSAASGISASPLLITAGRPA
jgi:hypothetical protein